MRPNQSNPRIICQALLRIDQLHIEIVHISGQNDSGHSVRHTIIYISHYCRNLRIANTHFCPRHSRGPWLKGRKQARLSVSNSGSPIHLSGTKSSEVGRASAYLIGTLPSREMENFPWLHTWSVPIPLGMVSRKVRKRNEGIRRHVVARNDGAFGAHAAGVVSGYGRVDSQGFFEDGEQVWLVAHGADADFLFRSEAVADFVLELGVD